MSFVAALIAAHTIIGTFSVIINAFLLFVIVLVTPKNSRAYAILMGATALWDLIGALSGLSCMSRLLTVEKHIILISHGPCLFVSTQLCFLSFDMFLACANATYYTTLAAFIARLMILRKGSITKQMSLTLLATCVLWHTIAFFIIFGTSQIPDELARSMIDRNIKEYSSELNIMATDNIFSFNVAYALVHICIVIFPVYIVIWSLRVATVRSLNRKASKMSNSTLTNHERIVKILTLQSIIPFMPVLCNVLFIVRQVTRVRNPLFETSTLLILELSAIFSPTIVFVNLPVYRRVVQRIFRCSTVKITTESDHVNSSEQRRPVMRVKSADRRS